MSSRFEIDFALEISFDEARSCLCDALLVARERECHGVATLIGCALERLETIGKLTGIHKSRLIGWQGPEAEDDEKDETQAAILAATKGDDHA